MDVFETSKLFPREEIYSLTDQVRRSSKRVCANLGRHIVKKCIQLILFQKFRTAIQKIRKQMCGSIFLWLANTSHTKTCTNDFTKRGDRKTVASHDQQSREVLTYFHCPLLIDCPLPIIFAALKK
jgi:hypothetical protein